MAIEWLLYAVSEVIGFMAEVIPRLPSSILSFATGLQTTMSGLASDLPYVGLVPWSTVGTAVNVLISAWLASIVIHGARTVIAWLRSRGTSDD